VGDPSWGLPRSRNLARTVLLEAWGSCLGKDQRAFSGCENFVRSNGREMPGGEEGGEGATSQKGDVVLCGEAAVYKGSAPAGRGVSSRIPLLMTATATSRATARFASACATAAANASLPAAASDRSDSTDVGGSGDAIMLPRTIVLIDAFSHTPAASRSGARASGDATIVLSRAIVLLRAIVLIRVGRCEALLSVFIEVARFAASRDSFAMQMATSISSTAVRHVYR